jgi:hypothetical protein
MYTELRLLLYPNIKYHLPSTATPNNSKDPLPRRREDKRGSKEVYEHLSIPNETHGIRKRLGEKMSAHADD